MSEHSPDDSTVQPDSDPGWNRNHGNGWGLRRFSRLATKELREILRDRRTIITLVLMPLLVYPLLSLVLSRVLIKTAKPASAESSGTVLRLGFENATEQAMFESIHERLVYFRSSAEEFKRNGQQSDEREVADAAAQPEKASAEENLPEKRLPDLWLNPENIKFEFARATGGESANADDEGVIQAAPVKQQPELVSKQTLEEIVADGKIDVGLRIKTNDLQIPVFGFKRGVDVEMVYRDGDVAGEDAARYLGDLFRFGNESNLRMRLRLHGFDSLNLVTQKLKSVEAAPIERTNTLATLIPLILTLMTITGAVYPAIDLTAGERERGTLETLIAAPIPRMGILLSKFVAVFTVAQLTAFVNLIGMMVTIWAFQLDKLLFDDGITLLMIVQIMGLVALFAGFFSAILLAITSFARSFKEAQAYLIPVMLISMTPGLGALMPDLQLKGPLVVLPLINMVLLARDILQGEANVSVAIIAITSTFIYGALALAIAARIFGTHTVLFSTQQNWRSFFLPPRETSDVCTVSGAFLCLALLFPANFLWLGALNRVGGSPPLRLALMTVGTILLFAIFPACYALFQRVRPGSGLGLRRGRWIAYPAAMLLGCSLGIMLIQIYSSIELISEFFVSMTPEQIELKKQQVQDANRVVDSWRQLPAPLLLIALSVVPAFCEELFFRGLLFRALLKRSHLVFAVVVSGLMFGLFHILSQNLLALQRFLPTALMGMVLAMVCYQAHSVIPGIILHSLHNLILVSTAIYNDWLVEHGWISPQQESLPLPLVLGAVACAAVGFLMLFLKSPPPERTFTPVIDEV